MMALLLELNMATGIGLAVTWEVPAMLVSQQNMCDESSIEAHKITFNVIH